MMKFLSIKFSESSLALGNRLDLSFRIKQNTNLVLGSGCYENIVSFMYFLICQDKSKLSRKPDLIIRELPTITMVQIKGSKQIKDGIHIKECFITSL